MKNNRIVDKFWDDLWFIHIKSNDKGLDLIARFFDDCFKAGTFDVIDEILFVGSDYRNFSTEIHVGILSFSLAAKEKLPNREKYFRMCQELFKKRHPDRMEKLLDRLS